MTKVTYVHPDGRTQVVDDAEKVRRAILERAGWEPMPEEHQPKEAAAGDQPAAQPEPSPSDETPKASPPHKPKTRRTGHAK